MNTITASRNSGTPQIFPDDTHRARGGDPLQSHKAADKSQQTLKPARRGILELIQIVGPLTGAELNVEYPAMQFWHGWPRLAADSPRKRAGDLCRDGLLVNCAPDGEDSRYELSLKGLEALS